MKGKKKILAHFKLIGIRNGFCWSATKTFFYFCVLQTNFSVKNTFSVRRVARRNHFLYHFSVFLPIFIYFCFVNVLFSSFLFYRRLHFPFHTNRFLFDFPSAMTFLVRQRFELHFYYMLFFNFYFYLFIFVVAFSLLLE